MTSPSTWFEALAGLKEAGIPCAVVVVTEVSGSAPRESGARLIVAEGKLAWGTIGGGNLEHIAIAHGTELLKEGGHLSESREYPLAESTGQCCGGKVTLFYETYPWTTRQVVIFGAGHVAQALAGLHGYLGSDLLLIDSREEAELQPPVPGSRPWSLLCVDEPEEEIDVIPPSSLVLIMTHDHALDLRVLEKALTRGTFPYVGLIGSDRKWLRFQKRLAERGYSPEQIASVVCPIGSAKTSKEPKAIAVSVAAELLEVLHGLAAR